MADQHDFAHLQLLLRFEGAALLRGGGHLSPQSIANRNARQAHTQKLLASGTTISTNWKQQQQQREQQGLPVIPQGVPILILIDPDLDLDVLREKFDFEIVAEQEEGYVIVAAHDIELAAFQPMVRAFEVEVHGSARIASVHSLFDDPAQADRLRRTLSETLFAQWQAMPDAQIYIVDVGIACTGIQEVPNVSKRGKRASDADWAAKEREWSQARAAAYEAWDAIRLQRENEIEQFVAFYEAEILHMVDGAAFDAVLPDSFSIRLKINGRGLKDFVLNYPYVFEVLEPEDIGLPSQDRRLLETPPPAAAPKPPVAAAPAVCVIDSGIQEAHVLLEPAIDRPTSFCFLPGRQADVGDFVRPGGHGTRVGGAVLYGESVPKQGEPDLPFWLQNARVLDENNKMPVEMFPPQVIRAVVERFHKGPRRTRIFNHSINANVFCRTRYMSAWAAEIDVLSAIYDILIIQSAGNLQTDGVAPYLGIKNYISAGHDYPAYFYEPSARIANPAQSLQALTVGSIAYGPLAEGEWKTFARQVGHPSAFSRSGLGIWSVIKPEVVEHGGDDVRTANNPVDVQTGGVLAAACPELVRSTMFPPGPAFDRDATGTSFAAPKVARIAARLENILPEEPSLLYRVLIVQSARWPVWAEDRLAELRNPALDDHDRREQLVGEVSRLIRCIGYGVPDEGRATTNSDHRVTFITQGEAPIKARECHIYEVPIPIEIRRQGDEFDIRIDVTLSFSAQPRRTRRHLRRYMSTWVDWKSSKLGEGINDFRVRAMKDETNDAEPLAGSVLPWTLSDNSKSGFVRGTRRNNGTVQKDWAVVKSNGLPEDFCIAVVGHQGWSRDPDSAASYVLTVTLEIVGKEIAIYEPLRVAVTALRAQLQEGIEVEVEAGE
jgi:Subtilase family